MSYMNKEFNLDFDGVEVARIDGTAKIEIEHSNKSGHDTRKLSDVQLPVSVTWHDLSVKAEKRQPSTIVRLAKSIFNAESQKKFQNPKDDYILKNVHGSARPGEILAILGQSGSGKTTLLNVISQTNLHKFIKIGTVLVNGQELSQFCMNKMSAYVQQDDLFIGSLTAREHLHFYATLRMGNKVSKKQRDIRVAETIADLGMTCCADTMIGVKGSVKGLSGGERKRLAFACETITSPPILICDEPTSGLDSFLAEQVIQVLKNLANQKNMTIITTIHQPSSQIFALLDRICLMANGRVAFTGTITEAISMWHQIGHRLPKNCNPAEHFIATLAIHDDNEPQCVSRIDEICNQFDRSELGKATYKEAIGLPQYETDDENNVEFVDEIPWRNGREPKYKSGWFTQLKLLMWRSMLTTIRDPFVLRIRIFQTAIAAVIIGLFYLGTEMNQATVMNYNGVLFILVTNMNYLFQFTVINKFSSDLPIFLREHQSGLYSTGAYFLAKNFAEIPQFIILPLLFTTVLYWMSGLTPQFEAFAISSLTCILMANVSISLGYMMSCIFKSVGVSLSLINVFILPSMATAGFFANLKTLPPYFQIIRPVSYFGYAYEVLAITEWTHVSHIPGCGNRTDCFNSGTDVLNALGFNPSKISLDIIVLVIMIFVIRLIAFIGLYTQTLKR